MMLVCYELLPAAKIARAVSVHFPCNLYCLELNVACCIGSGSNTESFRHVVFGTPKPFGETNMHFKRKSEQRFHLLVLFFKSDLVPFFIYFFILINLYKHLNSQKLFGFLVFS